MKRWIDIETIIFLSIIGFAVIASFVADFIDPWILRHYEWETTIIVAVLALWLFSLVLRARMGE